MHDLGIHAPLAVPEWLVLEDLIDKSFRLVAIKRMLMSLNS